MCARDVIESAQDEIVVEKMAAPTRRPVAAFNQLNGLKMKHNIHTNPCDDAMQKTVAYQPDLLAATTGFVRLLLEFAAHHYATFKKTNTYAVLTRTPQPLCVGLAVLAMALWHAHGACGSPRQWKALYVVALATHLGVQVWMTLVSGLVLYFSIPRHEFGSVQQALFPAYYTFNSIASFCALLGYYQLQVLTRFENTRWHQMMLLFAVFMIEVNIRLWLVAPMLKLKHVKTRMEAATGGGREVGKLVLGELAHCPHYMKILRSFRHFHSVIALGTMITLGCSIYSIGILVDSVC